MNASLENPTLHFFRATPQDMLKNAPLASSLQSLESAFFLLALGRFPGALVSCVSAWESAIKAKLRIPPDDDRTPLAKSLATVRESHQGLMRFDKEKLKQFRETRNRIVHYGFSPHDDEECGRLLLETGLPFLTALYQELFGFHLNWRDARPGIEDFMQLSPEEAACVGLLPDLSDQIHIANAMFLRNQDNKDFDVLHCYTAFTHYLRFLLRDSYASPVDEFVTERAASIGVLHEAEAEQKQKIAAQLSGETWEFDCPMCRGHRSIVAGLNEDALQNGVALLSWGVCVSCNLVMPGSAHHLANLVLQDELKTQRTAILEHYV
jgi:hypothetical protein